MYRYWFIYIYFFSEISSWSKPWCHDSYIRDCSWRVWTAKYMYPCANMFAYHDPDGLFLWPVTLGKVTLTSLWLTFDGTWPLSELRCHIRLPLLPVLIVRLLSLFPWLQHRLQDRCLVSFGPCHAHVCYVKVKAVWFLMEYHRQIPCEDSFWSSVFFRSYPCVALLDRPFSVSYMAMSGTDCMGCRR